MVRAEDVVANLQILDGERAFGTAWKALPRPRRRIVLAAVRGGRAVADPELAAFAVGYIVRARGLVWLQWTILALFSAKTIRELIRYPVGKADWWVAAGGGILIVLAVIFRWRVINPRHARAERLNREMDTANRIPS